jgi:hypothetical protein
LLSKQILIRKKSATFFTGHTNRGKLQEWKKGVMSAFHAGNRGELVLSDAEGNPFAVQQELVRLRRIQILL